MAQEVYARIKRKIITLGSDNEYLLSTHQILRNQAERLPLLGISSETRGAADEHNEKIRDHYRRLLTLLERNTEQFETLTEEHIKLFQTRVLQYLGIL